MNRAPQLTKTIALDLDDTLVDTMTALVDWIEETRGYRVDESRLAGYQLGDDIQQTMAIFEAFHAGDAHHKIGAVAGAVDGCRALTAAGFQLVVVTARKPDMVEKTNALIARLFPGVFKDVHCVGHQPDKTALLRSINASVLIDDNFRQIRRAFEAGIPTVLFGDLPWNRGIFWPRRARTWPDAAAMAGEFLTQQAKA